MDHEKLDPMDYLLSQYADPLSDEEKERVYKNIDSVANRERLLLSHLRFLYRMALRSTNQQADAEDRLQEYVAELLKVGEKFDPAIAGYGAFSGKVAHNVDLHAYRKAKRNKEWNITSSEQRLFAEIFAKDLPSPKAQQEEENLIESLREAMMTLRESHPNWHKVVVRYFGLDEQVPQNCAEMAREAGKSTSEYSRRFRDAIRELCFLMNVERKDLGSRNT